MHGLHRIDHGTDGLSERIAPAIAHRPQTERELVLRRWLQSHRGLRTDHFPPAVTSSVAVVSWVELVPTITSNRPGSTTRFIWRSINDKASGPSVNVTVFFSPGFRVTRSNPRSSFVGLVTELTTSWM